MKIQSMTIIFIIIILPITLVLSAYIQNQTKTLQNQISYDSKLYTATYDAIKAFQLNTVNNTESDIANSKIRDIQASVNTFFNSVASNFNLSGYNKDTIQEFVPAIVFTMYDGYYIYSPYEKICNEKGEVDFNSAETTYGLKPYVYYSCRYIRENDDFVITYSLDNYIKIQGIIKDNYVNDAGYVIDYMNVEIKNDETVIYRGSTIEEESLTELVGDTEYKYAKISGTKYYYDNNEEKVFYILNGNKQYLYGNIDDDNSTAREYYDKITSNSNAKNYYKEAYEFSKRLKEEYGLGALKVSNAYITNSSGDGVKIDSNNNTLIFGGIDKTENTIVEPDSNFNSHRLDVIKNAIQTNLSTAIAGYNNYSGSSTNFQMPKLKETEWELVLNNICVITFLQGMNIGGKVYNGYCVIPNNKTKEVVTEDSIYITASDGYYYKVGDEKLLKEDITIGKGYFNLDFEIASIKNDNGNLVYYYSKRYSKDNVYNVYLGSYTSIVGSSGISTNWDGNVYKYLNDPDGDKKLSEKEKALAKAYYTALGRERYSMYRY